MISFARSASIGLGVAALFALAGGCGDGSSGGGAGIGGDEFAAGYCPLLAPCCAETGLPAPGQGCRAFFGAIPPVDRQAAADCLEAYKARAQESNWCSEATTGERPEACARAWPQSGSGPDAATGSAQPGEACEETRDCAPSAVGDAQCSFFDDVCVVYADAGEGDSCIGERSGNGTSISGDAVDFIYPLCDRVAGEYCSFAGETRACAKFAELGAGCGAGEECVEGAFCLEEVCTPRGGPGAPCDSFQYQACNEITFCSEASNTCESLLADGAPCRVNSDCLSSYCNGESCEQSSLGGGLTLAVFCN